MYISYIYIDVCIIICVFLLVNVGFFELLRTSQLSPYWKLFKQVDAVLKSKKHFFFHLILRVHEESS